VTSSLCFPKVPVYLMVGPLHASLGAAVMALDSALSTVLTL
jgi:hypothetical protein